MVQIHKETKSQLLYSLKKKLFIQFDMHGWITEWAYLTQAQGSRDQGP